MDKINFKTPGGLKIRLNHRYFFCQLTSPDRFYTDEEIVNNDKMYNATANIESMFLIPTMLVQVFSLISLIIKPDILTFYVVSFALYFFGCVWRCANQDILLSTILLFLSTIYKAVWWILYAVLVVFVFVFNSAYLVFPYLIARVALFVFSMILNHITLSITKKKYGVPFGDTEMCAFRVFHILSESNIKISDYIKLYVSVVHGSEVNATNPSNKQKEFEQLSIFDSIEDDNL